MRPVEHVAKCRLCGKEKRINLFTKESLEDPKKKMCKACQRSYVSILVCQRKASKKTAGHVVRTKYATNNKKPLKVINSCKVKTKRQIENKKAYDKLKKQVHKLLGNQCKHCKIKDKIVLQVDHVNGGGTQERRGCNSLGRYKKVLANPSKYQLLCANCNIRKKYLNKEH